MYFSPFTILLLLLEGKESSTGSPLQILHEFIVPKFININSSLDGANSFNGTNVAAVDVDYWKDKGSAEGKIFITTPRQKPGTTASLSTIVKENSESVLSPYPSAEANLPTCNNIVSAFRTQADSCNRLWVIDSGVIDSALEDSKRICPPKVLIYNLKTDKLISKHEVPDKILKPDSLLTTIVTDIRGNECENAFAYIADVQGYQIIVFDLKNEKFWQFHNKYHYPDPTEGTFNINGVTFDLMDGILGLALGPVIRGDRTLFFHSLASRRESWVQTSVLQNSSLAGDLNSASEYFKTSAGVRSSKSAAESMDKYGVLFFGLLEENTLACWPSWVPYRSTNIKKLVKDNEKLQFISGIKVVGDDLWIISSKLQNFFADKVDINKINYRVIRASIDQLTRGTKCRRTRREIYHEHFKNNHGTEDFSNFSVLSREENNEDEDIIT